MIQQAISVARTKADHKIFLHAALIVRKNHILSEGYNHERVHAEEHAIYKCQEVIKGSEILCIRIRRSGRMGMARPCPACWALLKSCGVLFVRYSDSHGNIVKEKIR